MSGQDSGIYTLGDARLRIEQMDDIMSKYPSTKVIDKLAKFIRSMNDDELRNVLRSRAITMAGNRLELESRVFNGFINGMIANIRHVDVDGNRDNIQDTRKSRKAELINIIMKNNEVKTDCLVVVNNRLMMDRSVLMDKIVSLDEDIRSYLSRTVETGVFTREDYDVMMIDLTLLYDKLYKLEDKFVDNEVKIVNLNLEYTEAHRDYETRKVIYESQIDMLDFIANQTYERLYSQVTILETDNLNARLLERHQSVYAETNASIDDINRRIDRVRGEYNREVPEDVNRYRYNQLRDYEMEYDPYYDGYNPDAIIVANIDRILSYRAFNEPDYGLNDYTFNM